MKTNVSLSKNIRRIVDEQLEKRSGETAATSTVTIGSTAGSVAGISDSSMLSNVLEYVGELIPEHFKGTGGNIIANTPANMSVIVTAFGDDSGIVAGGKLHTFIQDVIIKFSDVIGTDSVWYIQVDGNRVYRSQVRNRRHGCLGKIIITNKSQRIVDNDPVYINYSNREDENDTSQYDAYIVSAKDPLFDDEAFRFDDPFKATLKNFMDEILAENLIGTIRLHEGLTISNTQGTMNMDSKKVQFKTAAGLVLSEYGSTLAYVGNIEIHPDAIQSRNFNSGSAGFQIRDKGDAEFNNVTVRGTIYATLGQIGGFDITSTTIESTGGEIILDSSNLKITLNDSTFGNEGIQLDYNGGSPRLYVGDGSNQFLQYDGYLYVKGTIYGTAGFFGTGSTVISIANDGLNIGADGNIRGGQTAYDTGTGFWMGYSSSYKFSIGIPGSKYFKFDGSDISWKGVNTELTAAGAFTASSATITGTVNATAGYFGSGSTVVSIASGGLTIGTGGYLKGGQTAYDTGTGFWMGYDSGAYKFSIGNSSGNKLTWNGSTLSVTGGITATTGAIGGWSITSTEIKSIVTGTAGIILNSSNPSVAVNDGTRNRVYIGKTGSDYGIEVYDASGNTIFESSGATDILAGWTLTSTYFSKNNVKIDSAGVISVGGTTLGTAGVQLYYNAVDARGEFYAGDGSNKYLRYDYNNGVTWKGPNTELNSSGNLICSGGTIGGFTISSTQLYNSTNIIVDASSKYIALKDSTFGNDGIQLQYNGGNPRAYIGNGSTRYFEFDGSNISWSGGNSSMDTTGNLTCVGGTIGGWSIGATALTSSNITIDSGNDRITVNTIVVDGANNRIRSTNYVSGANGAGFNLDPNLLEVGNVSVRGILRTAVFQKDVISAVGGSVMILDADVLDADMTASDTSNLTIEGNTTWTTGDILRIKDGTDDEWFTITSAVSAPTYAVTRDRAGDYAANNNPAWTKGATVVNYGQSGDGGLYMTSSETNAPYLSVFAHTGSPWTALSTKVRLGNLNGSYGYSSDIYGLAMGETGGTNVTIDATNGFRVRDNTTNKFQVDSSGNLTATGTLQTATSNARIVLSASTGRMTIYNSSGDSLAQLGDTVIGGSESGLILSHATNGGIIVLQKDSDNDMYIRDYNIIIDTENAGGQFRLDRDNAGSTTSCIDIDENSTSASFFVDCLSGGSGGIFNVLNDGDVYTNGEFQVSSTKDSATRVIVDEDYGIKLYGDSTVYNDLQFTISSGKVPAANYPTWETFTTNTNEFSFAVNDYIDMDANEVPHSWLLESSGDVHLHVTTKAANSTGGNVYAKFTVYVSSCYTGSTWTETSFTQELTIPNGTSALQLFYLDMGNLTLTSYTLETEIKVRVKRIAATSGTEYPGNIFITQAGIHLQDDSMGSRDENSK